MTSIRSRAPKASSHAVRRVMKANSPKDTRPELRLRRSLHAAKLRYRTDMPPEQDLGFKADVLFPRHRVAVFVDGCFWHGCSEHFRPPKTNREWWIEKIEDNVRRDIRATSELSARGWNVLRFWEHQLATEEDVAVALKKVRSELDGAMRSLERAKNRMDR